jgi:hypothetical protein
VNVNFQAVKAICETEQAKTLATVYPDALVALLAMRKVLCSSGFYGPYLAITDEQQVEAAKMEGVVESVGSIYLKPGEVILCQLTPDVIKETPKGYLIRHDIEGNCGILRAKYRSKTGNQPRGSTSA